MSPENLDSAREKTRLLILHFFHFFFFFQTTMKKMYIIILLADKGSTTMVIDKMEYSNKFADLIGNGEYCKVKRNLALKTEGKLSQILS